MKVQTSQAFSFIEVRLNTISVLPELDDTSTAEPSTMAGNTEQAAPINEVYVSTSTVSPSMDSADSEAQRNPVGELSVSTTRDLTSVNAQNSGISAVSFRKQKDSTPSFIGKGRYRGNCGRTIQSNTLSNNFHHRSRPLYSITARKVKLPYVYGVEFGKVKKLKFFYGLAKNEL